MKKLCTLLAALGIFSQVMLNAHCQMPCGIYHDEIAFDQIDQYIETMYKAISEINENKEQTPKDRTQLIRWVYQKEIQTDEAGALICTYFLQQKIKPDADDTTKKLICAHKLLFLLVQIKQNCDIKLIHDFMDEWSNFKLMFHREGYECKIEKMKLEKWQKDREQLESKEQADHTHDHDHHDHDHDHPHEDKAAPKE